MPRDVTGHDVTKPRSGHSNQQSEYWQHSVYPVPGISIFVVTFPRRRGQNTSIEFAYNIADVQQGPARRFARGVASNATGSRIHRCRVPGHARRPRMPVNYQRQAAEEGENGGGRKGQRRTGDGD